MRTIRTNFNRKRQLVIQGITAIVFILIGIYVYTNLRLPWSKPVISVDDSYLEQVSTGTIHISGITKRTKTLTLNGDIIPISRKGEFSDTIYIPIGYSVLEIKATDRFGHSTREVLPVYRSELIINNS
jgi:hypothetical protein